uniref:Large ribosomal subunit protein uL29 n=1 Tax=uncultured Chloroflexi bacterium Rifle_16ft_4_minimus_1477 TaxID=1665058 RepID=A0A0H4T0Q7_9CHLR|nr:50S ribosomal protein L29, large subunit ribosomal protein L29 [uncultured Chloroflexi bacterium Rifle_16ft_4_minimus_1477]
MKPAEIRKMPVEKLEQELDAARERLMKMRFQIATGELKDQNQPRLLRHDVARMETILKEKRSEAKAEAKAEGAK